MTHGQRSQPLYALTSRFMCEWQGYRQGPAPVQPSACITIQGGPPWFSQKLWKSTPTVSVYLGLSLFGGGIEPESPSSDQSWDCVPALVLTRGDGVGKSGAQVHDQKDAWKPRWVYSLSPPDLYQGPDLQKNNDFHPHVSHTNSQRKACVVTPGSASQSKGGIHYYRPDNTGVPRKAGNG